MVMTNDRHWARLTTRARIVGETPDSPLDPAGAKRGICQPTINSGTSEASDPQLADRPGRSAGQRNDGRGQGGPDRTYAGMAPRHHQRGPLAPAEFEGEALTPVAAVASALASQDGQAHSIDTAGAFTPH